MEFDVRKTNKHRMKTLVVLTGAGVSTENEWQSFRTKRNPALELAAPPHRYNKPGRYKIMVKVIDILGIDTSKVMEVVIK